jgi:hypothetical protein
MSVVLNLNAGMFCILSIDLFCLKMISFLDIVNKVQIIENSWKNMRVSMRRLEGMASDRVQGPDQKDRSAYDQKAVLIALLI